MKILVVDDVPDAADALAALLRSWAHDVLVAYDGAAALSLAEQQPPECAMLDLHMQGMDGEHLSRQLRQRFGDDLVIIGITGDAQVDLAIDPRLSAMDHCLLKPVDAQLLERMFPRRGG